MKSIKSSVVLLLLAVLPALSQERLQLEKPRGEETVHHPYGYAGLAFGSLTPVSDTFRDVGSNQARLGLALGWVFLPMTTLDFGADWSLPDGGYGMQVGVVQNILPTGVSPFIGASVGFRDPGDDRKFGDRFGPTLGASAGVHFFRQSDFQVRLRGGWEMIANKDKDQSVQADIALLVSIGRPGLKALKVD